MITKELSLCECGCGKKVMKEGNRFINGHNRRGVSHTPKACAAMSSARKGVPKPPRTPEYNAALSEIITNSEAAKAAAEAQRGGNDLVNHHYIYDESDLSKNTVQMTRSDHMKLHRLLQKLGYIIPHVNLPDKPTKRFISEQINYIIR